MARVRILSPVRAGTGSLLPRLVLSAVPLVFFVLHVTGLQPLEFLQRMESYLYDVRVRLLMPRVLDPRVVIVDIDETSLAKEGRWPWPRDKIARLLDRLFDDYAIKAVGFDVLFAEAEQSGALRLLDELAAGPLGTDPAVKSGLDALRPRYETDRQFAESLVARDVVLGYVFKPRLAPGETAERGTLPAPIAIDDPRVARQDWIRPHGYVANLPELQEAAAAGGFFDTPLVDDDGVVRRAPLVQYYGGRLYESLAFALARVGRGGPPLRLGFDESAGSGGGVIREIDLGETAVPVDGRGAVLIPFRGPVGSFRYVPATDVLSGAAPKEHLQGAIVLVGTSAPGLLDIRPAPVAKEYIGVEAHANVISGLLDGTIPFRPQNSGTVEIAGLCLLALLTALVLPRLGAVAGLALFVALCALLVGGNLWAWSRAGMVLPVASLLAYAAIATLLQLTYGYFTAARKRQRLSRLFGQYVPPEIVQELDAGSAEVSLEGESRRMSVLFSDVRGFTTISEGLAPRELTALMNEFLTPITAVIQGHRGTIDKYMGDAVMAFWGAPLPDPEHARHAVLAALEMVTTLASLAPAFRARGWPELRIGVGVSSGEMNVGNMGSRFRMAYTVLGDTVNLGSRLEGLTKQYGVSVIVSAATAAAVPEFVFRELDLVRVKGKVEPVAIYEPLGPAPAVSDEERRALARFGQALVFYRRREWDAADALLAELEAGANRKVYGLYRARIAHFRMHPPTGDWDGVFVFETK